MSFMIFLSDMSCTWDQLGPKIDCSISPIEIELLESSPTPCGASDGSFTVTATGGEPPYVYKVDSRTNADGIFENLEAGNYSVLVTDTKDCGEEISVLIQNLNGVNLQEATAVNAGCGSANGGIQIVASGGEQPYIYSLNGGAEQADNLFSGLNRGVYTISVKDQLGCEVTENIEVLSGVSYEGSIKNIIKNSCAGCHSNFSSYSNVKSRAADIKRRTESGDMPRGSTLSRNQIDLLACWVDDGALEN